MRGPSCHAVAVAKFRLDVTALSNLVKYQPLGTLSRLRTEKQGKPCRFSGVTLGNAEILFPKQAQLARNWYDTLHSMVTPWSEFLTETRRVLRLGLATSLSEQLSDEALSAAQKEGKVREAC